MFYSSLFDTGSKDALELQLAEALLRVHTLMEQGPTLTALHAINSTLILDRCASDPYFLALVEKGAVRFRARWNGVAPRELFKQMLSSTGDVYLGAWGTQIIESQDERRKLSARLNEGRETSGVSTEVDERLERLRRLLDAIDTSTKNCGPLAREGSYTIPFKTLFEEKVRRTQQSADPCSGSLVGVLGDLAREQIPHGNRTDLYRAIDRRQCSEELKSDLKAFVDTTTNQLVAESLGLRGHYHSAYRGVGSVFAREDEILERGDIVRVDGEEIKEFDDLKFEWRDIEARAPSPNEIRGESGVRVTLRKLAEQYRDRAISAPISEEAGQEFGKALFTLTVATMTTSATATTGMVVFEGWFGAMLFGVVGAAIGGAVGLGGPKLNHRRRFRKAERVLTSLHSKISGSKRGIW